LPDIPTVGDFLRGYEASTVYGVGAPKNTPVDIVDRLNEEINAAFADFRLRARFADLGLTPLPASASDYAKLLANETEKWAKVLELAGVKLAE
jgi:tripartite-type tricarboxylate transporter receptor subunit TctC